MLRDIVEYKDIDGIPTTKTVFFNLTQFEVEGEMDLETIQARFQKFMDEVIGDDPNAPIRDMTGPEKREMLGMVKTLIQHSYGIKNGKRFDKSKDIWDEFVATGAFSAYLYQLFLQEGAVNRFMEGIWPQGVDRQTPDGSALSVVPDLPAASVATDAAGQATVQDADWNYINFTREQLLAMSAEDWTKVLDASRQGRNVPLPLLQLDGQRKSQSEGEPE